MANQEPWPNQHAAAAWLGLRQYGHLSHEMGTGKSRSLLMAYQDQDVLLIVCPIPVGAAWAKQISLFDPTRRCVVAVSGPSAKRAVAIRDAIANGGRLAVVVNYDSVWRGEVAKAIKATRWSAIVLDESHRIKSPSAKTSRWLCKLAESQPHAKRACLTGTPTPHSPLDWYSQFKFLDSSLVPYSYSDFRNRIAVMHPRIRGWVTSFKPDALQAFRKHIDPHVHRVTAEEVLALPEAIHIQIPVELSKATRTFYGDLEREMIAQVEDGTVTASNRMVVVGRLQAATSGFTRADGEEHFRLIDGVPDKRLRFQEFLEDFPSEPLVVFTKFLEDIRQAKDAVLHSGRTVSELSGQAKELETWQAGKTDVIVVQQQTGGAGIDLTRACHCVYWSLSHSLGDYEQSLARIRRPGQSKCCRYYHLVATDSVDETIYESLQEKKDVVESILARLTKRTGVAAR